jgi:hypothetical protein
VPGKAAVEMKSKVFNMVLLRDLHIIYIDLWARCASSIERHIDRLSFISFHTPSFSARIGSRGGRFGVSGKQWQDYSLWR